MIRFGIIGTAAIVHRFLKGLAHCKEAEAVALVSRDLQRAAAFCEGYSGLIPYDSYEDFYAQSLDVVYIATPNYTHKALIMDALRHHVHVLCEKPMVLHAEDVKDVFAYAKAQSCILMEGMKPCFLPTTMQAKQWIEEGRIGKLRLIEAGYCHQEETPFLSGWHSDLKQGGGTLYDIGVYPIGFVHAIVSQEPSNLKVSVRKLQNGADCFVKMLVQFGDVIADLMCGCDTPMDNRAILYGTKGTIIIHDFWKSEQAELHTEDQTILFTEPHDRSEFRYEIAAMIQSIQRKEKENAIMSESMSVRTAKLVDMVLQEGDLL